MHSILNAPRFLSFVKLHLFQSIMNNTDFFAFGGYVINMKNDKL